MSIQTYLYGKNPLEEAILAQTGTSLKLIEELYITKDAQNNPKIMSLVQAAKIPYVVVTKEEIESRVGRSSIHQGICALLKNDAIYSDFKKTISDIKKQEGNKLIVVLDELEDPHNVGAIIRSAKAFGAKALVIGEHNQVEINGTVIKSASGMNFHIPIIKVGNINDAIRNLKEERFWIYGLTKEGDSKLEKTTFDEDTAIVIGSEGKGIKDLTLKLCDFKLSIRIDEDCESLNASNACAVTLYEWNKQNK